MTYLDVVRQSLQLLSPAERRRYRVALALQVLLSLLDLLGIALIGGVGLIVGAAASGSALPPTVVRLADTLSLGGAPPSTLALAVAGSAAIALIGKSAFSLLLQRWIYSFLARCTASVAADLAEEFLSQELIHIQKRPSHWNSYAFVEGLSEAVTTVLAQFQILVGETALLLTVTALLLIVDTPVTVVAFAYFGLVVFGFNKVLGRRASQVAGVRAGSTLESRSAVHDGIATFRELSVAGRQGFYRDHFIRARASLAISNADTQYIAAVPRYGMEAALVIGAALLVAMILATRDPESALGGLFLFLAAASRVTPSLLRLNSANIMIHSAGRGAEPTFTLADELGTRPTHLPLPTAPSEEEHREVDTDISADGLTLTYPGRSTPALRNVTLQVPRGTSIAIVGPSGAGKSTLVDVLMGVALPDTGFVRVGSLDPVGFIALHPGQIAYIPQDVVLVHGTVRDNVALGLQPDKIDDSNVWSSLDQAKLGDFIRSQPELLGTPVGERGVRLSGGQRQRLGLARALYSSPRILVMDEATSALDAETEHAIRHLIAELGSTTTTITIAHRLATIIGADQVIYMNQGQVLARGTFDEVRHVIPDFDTQAKLMGL